jgi:hypothetical protein
MYRDRSRPPSGPSAKSKRPAGVSVSFLGISNRGTIRLRQPFNPVPRTWNAVNGQRTVECPDFVVLCALRPTVEPPDRRAPRPWSPRPWSPRPWSQRSAAPWIRTPRRRLNTPSSVVRARRGRHRRPPVGIVRSASCRIRRRNGPCRGRLVGGSGPRLRNYVAIAGLDRQARDRLLHFRFAIMIAPVNGRPWHGRNHVPRFGMLLPDRTRMVCIRRKTVNLERGNGR